MRLGSECIPGAKKELTNFWYNSGLVLNSFFCDYLKVNHLKLSFPLSNSIIWIGNQLYPNLSDFDETLSICYLSVFIECLFHKVHQVYMHQTPFCLHCPFSNLMLESTNYRSKWHNCMKSTKFQRNQIWVQKFWFRGWNCSFILDKQLTDSFQSTRRVQPATFVQVVLR